ncbi:MAG: hypothetical protein JNM57_12840 [Cyclobacteriaceae bacterium]|nr:hypothetical protein [Cyclobacteriaceae bacterium]
MRKINFCTIGLLALALSACVTGGFDENPQLDWRNEELAKAPKVESISVNGVIVERNTQSIRVVHAKIGDVLEVSAAITSGKNAALKELEVSRQYYGEEDPQPLDPLSGDGFYDLTGNTFVFDYNYTVPAEDDDGFDFHAGDVILVYFRVRNTLDNFGYKAFEIHLED